MEIGIDLIRPSPYQPRLILNIDELKREIVKDGLLSDLVVRKRGEFYEIIDGERRWRALKELGWEAVPVRVVNVDDRIARRSVYKLNKIRENYTVEEEARYFKRLREEGMTPWEISKELNVELPWVLAHLNVFKFPEDIQNAVWTRRISISHVIALEKVIGRSVEEALAMINEILKRKLTLAETRKVIRERKAKIEKMRIKAVEDVLPEVVPEAVKLETPEDLEKVAKVLKKMARKKRKKALTPEEKALREAEEKRKREEMQRKREERRRMEEEVKEKTGKESIEGLVQTVRGLREKIETLESEKAGLLDRKEFLTEALGFNCPYCNHPCVIYREEGRYWVR